MRTILLIDDARRACNVICDPSSRYQQRDGGKCSGNVNAISPCTLAAPTTWRILAAKSGQQPAAWTAPTTGPSGSLAIVQAGSRRGCSKVRLDVTLDAESESDDRRAYFLFLSYVIGRRMKLESRCMRSNVRMLRAVVYPYFSPRPPLVHALSSIVYQSA